MTPALRTKVVELVRAARGMRDRWAEADEAVRAGLWARLHVAASDVGDSLALDDDEKRRAQ